MARARNIKPGFYTNEDLAECSVWARYIFPGLWMMADREGRLEYRPKKIKGELLRFDEQAAEPLLEELRRWGFIEIYEVAGRSYIQILTFHKHQNPHHRESESEIPPPQSPGLLPHGTTSKPGATNGSDDCEAQGKPEASPGLDAKDATYQGGQAGLIPDSGFLIPDSLNPEAAHVVVLSPQGEEKSDALPEFPSSLSPEQKAAVPLVVKLRALGVTITSANPLAAEWLAKGLTVDRADEAVEFARLKGKPSGPIHPNFLNALIDDILKPKAPKKRADDWYRTNPGIERKASELGILCPPGKSHDWLRERCESEIRKREQGVAA